MYDDFFTKAHNLTQPGIPFATATVIHAEKPTSAKPGDKAIITVDRVMHGWIGGSCAPPSVVKEALAALAADECRLMIFGALPVAQALAYLGKAMNYHVIAVDPDGQGAGMEHVDELLTDLAAIAVRVNLLT